MSRKKSTEQGVEKQRKKCINFEEGKEEKYFFCFL